MTTERGPARQVAPATGGGGLPLDGVLRRVQHRVDPSPPRFTVWNGRQLEFQRLPVAVEDEVEAEAFLSQFRLEGDAVGVFAPVRPAELYPVPGLVRLFDEPGQARSPFLASGVAQEPAGEQELDEPVHV